MFRNDPTVLDVILKAMDTYPDKAAVVHVYEGGPDDVVTYAQAKANAFRIARELEQRFDIGDRVLLMYPSGVEFVTGLIGSIAARMVAVPTPLPGQFQYQRERIERIARNAGAVGVLTNTKGHRDVQEWADQQPSRIQVVVTDDLGALVETGTEAWEPIPGDPADIVLLQYTSGATGDPKGVAVSHRNLLHNASCVSTAFLLDSTTPVGGWIPLYHDMGLMGQLLPSLLLGSTCVLLSPTAFVKRPRLWLQTIDRHRIHYSAAPNFGYELCTRRLTDADVATLDLSCWKVAANGSEPVAASTLHDFARRFASAGFVATSFTPSYGMAEATVYISGAPGSQAMTREVDAAALEQGELLDGRVESATTEIVSCGRVVDFTVLVIDPQSGKELPERRIGELWLQGPSVAQGYWGRPVETAESFRARTSDGRGPFLRTGDLGGLWDEQLYVTGRIKELIIIHGRNIYPQDVEHQIRQHHVHLATLSGAAFTLPGTAEELVILHEVRGIRDPDELATLASGIRTQVTRDFGVTPATVSLLRPGAIRKSTSGKVQRTQMRALFLAGELSPLATDTRLGAASSGGVA